MTLQQDYAWGPVAALGGGGGFLQARYPCKPGKRFPSGQEEVEVQSADGPG